MRCFGGCYEGVRKIFGRLVGIRWGRVREGRFLDFYFRSEGLLDVFCVRVASRSDGEVVVFF